MKNNYNNQNHVQVDEKPTDNYSDIGGLEKQIEELIEAIVLPMKHKDKFDAIGIKPPKGVLMHGPPGTGKTMMARVLLFCDIVNSKTIL